MSVTMIIGLLFILVCVLYGAASLAYRKKDVDTVIETEAGDTSNCKPLSTFGAPSRIIRMKDGTVVRSSDFLRIVIRGGCMAPRGILNGEEWLAVPVNRKNDIKSQIKEKDVLLLYIEDKKIYKIRELREFLGDGMLRTGYYNSDGTEHDSSREHSAEQVMGVVRYSI